MGTKKCDYRFVLKASTVTFGENQFAIFRQPLYVPVGAPCNVCLRDDDERYASILRMDPVTGETSVYAHCIRNSVGMSWKPDTGQLWFSENGRDWMGDDLPPDEINVVTRVGQHYGFPYLHGAETEPQFPIELDENGERLISFTEPIVEIQAHSAPLGITFYTHDHCPPKYCHALFIAEHGSWNRSSMVGYVVSVVTFPDEPDGESVYEHFTEPWLVEQRTTGRPTDVIVSHRGTGTLLVADDYANRVYEITYEPPPDPEMDTD